jgi:hypothetical protein
MLYVLKQQQTKVVSQMKRHYPGASKTLPRHKDLYAESISHSLHGHILLYAKPHLFKLNLSGSEEPYQCPLPYYY